MPTLIDTEDRLRNTLSRVASSVHENDGEPHTGGTLAESAIVPSSDLSSRGPRRRHPARVFAAAFVSVLAVGVIAVLSTGLPSDPTVDSTRALVAGGQVPSTAVSQPVSPETSGGGELQVEYPALTLEASGWSMTEILDHESESGRSVRVHFEEVAEDSPGRDLLLVLGIDSTAVSNHLQEFELAMGLKSEREVETRGRAAVLYEFGDETLALSWSEGAGIEALLVVAHGGDAELLVELGDALVPVSSEVWREMVAAFPPR